MTTNTTSFYATCYSTMTERHAVSICYDCDMQGGPHMLDTLAQIRYNAARDWLADNRPKQMVANLR